MNPARTAAAMSIRPAPRSNGSAGVAWSSLVTLTVSLPLAGTVKAVDISADLTWSGFHSGWMARTSAAAPAACGLDMDVPWMMLKSSPAEFGSFIQAAQMARPGAVTSGLITPGLDRSGPRELKPAMRSARFEFCSMVTADSVASGLTAPASQLRSDAPSYSLIITAGRTWVSARTLFLEPAWLTRTMPAPPAFLTLLPFSTRPMTPCVQITILPATCAAAVASNGLHSSLPSALASISATGPTPRVTAIPSRWMGAPLALVASSATVGRRLLVLAATAISHGALAGWPIVCGAGPLLPADAATKTPAAWVPKKACWRGPDHGSDEPPPIEKLMTSTMSAVAASIAAISASIGHVPRLTLAPGTTKLGAWQALYEMTLACGATPLMRVGPTSIVGACSDASTTLPATVLAVWLPWPTSSATPIPVKSYRPISLLLQPEFGAGTAAPAHTP